jgi:hypothetical protein
MRTDLYPAVRHLNTRVLTVVHICVVAYFQTFYRFGLLKCVYFGLETNNFSQISSSHDGEHEDNSFLGCSAM